MVEKITKKSLSSQIEQIIKHRHTLDEQIGNLWTAVKDIEHRLDLLLEDPT